MTQVFSEKDVIYTYTSTEAVEDGILFDVDLILKRPIKDFFLKYITTGLLEKGYWDDRCKNSVPNPEKGHNDRCASCDVWIQYHGNKLSCLQPTLNIANIFDLLMQAQRIFAKKASDDYFASGIIELPSGKKQQVFLAKNETGRYTIMLPEDY
jgi:hypothetical protein